MRSKQIIKAIILAGGRDVRHSSAVMRLPAALWPVAGKSVLARLLTRLANQGIAEAVIYSNGDGPLLARSIIAEDCPRLKFVDEPLPLGSAGCIRDAANGETNTLFMVFNASMISPPDIDVLIGAHLNGKSDLTMMFNPAGKNSNPMGEAAEIYICDASILENIPKEGYFDIKEGLIPEMLLAGKTIRAAVLPHRAGNFRDRQEYLCAIGDYLENGHQIKEELQILKKDDSRIIWAGAETKIDADARIYGPVVIMDGVSVSNGVVILGPTILGRNVNIDKDSVVINSVLWDDAKVGANCEIQRCLVDYHGQVQSDSVVQGKFIARKSEKVADSSISRILASMKSKAEKLQSSVLLQFDKLNEKLPQLPHLRNKSIVPWLAGSLVLIVFLWSYWPCLVDLWTIWQRSDEYSSGLLVPLLAIYILWSRRHKIAEANIKPSVWGLFAFIAAQGVRFFGLFFMYGSAERLSIVLSIAALVLLLFGWQFLRKVSTILLFLCLMLPWPTRIQAAAALPLQRWATSSAVFCLETVGYEIIQEGNVIHIGQATVAVAEACNGLRMITAFFVISGLVVLLVNRTWWEKLVILASSLPVALLCNTLRLVATAIAFTMLHGERWEKVFHDFGGYAMMPMALAIVVVELWLLTKLTIPPAEKEAIIVTRQNS
ncbi:MAG: exosortase [Phycisphaerae bacterium]|nr:exosortase [Phycisphaerae bacterium]